MGLTLEGAVSRTGPGANIQNPYGSYPGYISRLFNDCDRAKDLDLNLACAIQEGTPRGLRFDAKGGSSTTRTPDAPAIGSG